MARPEVTEQIAAARRGDNDAINALFERFYPTVQRIVHSSLAQDMRRGRPWLGALFSTGDVVQEVFISVLRDLSTFEGDSERAFVSYLSSITRNRLIDAIRFQEAVQRDRRRVENEPPTLHDNASEAPADAAAANDEIARYHSALQRTPERERLLLRGRIEEERPFAALAEELGYPSADAARKALYAAQARLLARLAPSGKKS